MIDLLRAPLQSIPSSSRTRMAYGFTRVTSVPAEKTSKSVAAVPLRAAPRRSGCAPSCACTRTGRGWDRRTSGRSFLVGAARGRDGRSRDRAARPRGDRGRPAGARSPGAARRAAARGRGRRRRARGTVARAARHPPGQARAGAATGRDAAERGRPRRTRGSRSAVRAGAGRTPSCSYQRTAEAATPARVASSAIFMGASVDLRVARRSSPDRGARLDDREATRGGRQRASRAQRAGELAEARRPPAGRSEYQIQVPRRSPSIQPASRRTLRWCDTVGWLTSQQAVKSQAQTSASRSAGGGSRVGWGRRRPGGAGRPGRSVASSRPLY